MNSRYFAYMVLVACSALLLYPVIFTHEASFFIKQDNLHQAYPFYNKLTIALHKGYLPVWDADTYGGKNFAGEMQAGIFYPMSIIWCWIFGSSKGIDTYHLDLLVALHYLICLLGMYKLARVFGLTTAGSIATALVFTFAGSVGARAAGQTCIFFGLTLLPWSVYFVARYYLYRRWKVCFILAGLIAGLEILAGHMQPFFHTMLIDGIVVFFYEYQAKKGWRAIALSTIVNLFLTGLFAILIALPQIYYTAQYMARALRTVSGGIFIRPGQKVPLFIYSHWFIIQLSNLGNFLGQGIVPPDDDNTLYMGILPLFLMVGYTLWYKRHKPAATYIHLTRLLTIILVIGGLSALGYLSCFYLILYEIPFVNLVRQLGRYTIMITFSLSLFTGMAITHLTPLKDWFLRIAPKKTPVLLWVLGINALFWIFVQSKDIPIIISVPFLLSFVFLLSLRFIKMPLHLPILALGIIFIDLLINPVDFLSTQTKFYPDRFYGRNRIIDSLEATYGKYRVMFDMQDYDQMRRNLGDIYNIQTKFGYGATVNWTYSNFIHTDAANPETDDLLNVRYVITDKNLDSSCVFKDSVHQLRLYERRSWYPRCYWKRQLGESGAQIESENKDDIHPLAYSDNGQRLEVTCDHSDTLIFSENDYPGWECLDNGHKIAIYTATISHYPRLFRSIFLTEGRHLIEFRYRYAFHWF